jgi:DNA-binding response OmpR family regulator
MDDFPKHHETTILIVEDSQTQAKILEHLLTSAGYNVIVCHNGREALIELHNNRPTMVLTDIVMPEMDGYELCREIKQNTSTSNIPVILVTQLYDPQDVVQGLECGADNFIIKPYDNQYLLSRIEVILANRFLQTNETMNLGIEVFFAGKRHFITSNRLQILNILLSTYEIAIQKNNELHEARDKLATLIDQISEANEYLKKVNEDLNREIAERKRIESALSMANKKLTLLSSITRHDMKNILMAVLGYHGLAIQDANDQKFLEYLNRETDLFAKLTNQIEFTRLYEEMGTTGAIWKPIKEVQNIKFPASERVTVTVTPQAEQYEIFTDPLIEKVFYNLFENAIRHGGNVTAISVSANIIDQKLQVLVCDNGSGISAADKDMIFRRGYGKNTGLGLFLVREILSITGITIDVISKEGEGACFEFIIPSDNFRTVEN